MATVHDVARYIVETSGEHLSALKLHKLAYYCQSWCVTWTGKPLIDDVLEARAKGPVFQSLPETSVDELAGNSGKLSTVQKQIISAVLERYAGLSGEDLSELTHTESPWLDARRTAEPHVIPVEALRSFYSAVSEAPKKPVIDARKAIQDAYQVVKKKHYKAWKMLANA